MVVSCSGCTYRHIKGRNVSFHGFPRDEKLLKIWLRNLKRKNFTPSHCAKLCSRHFEDHCFMVERFGPRRLKPDAVPTVFFNYRRRASRMQVKDKGQTQENGDKPNNEMADVQPNVKLEESPKLNLSPVQIKTEEYFVPCEFLPASPGRDEECFVPYAPVDCLTVKPERDPITPDNTAPQPSQPSTSSKILRKNKTYRYVGDFKAEDLATSDKMKRAFEMLKLRCLKQRQQLDSSQRMNRVMDKRLRACRALLSETQTTSIYLKNRLRFWK